MNQRNFVAPLPPVERREPVNIGVDALMTGEVIHVGEPLAARHGANETTSGMDRSKAWVVRMAPYTVIILVLSITLVNLAGGGWVLAFCLFASATLVVYLVMDGREHKYSRNGLERHKVNTLADLKFDEQDKTHELRMRALDMWMEVERAERTRLDVREQTFAVRDRTIEGRIAASPKGYLTRRADAEASED